VGGGPLSLSLADRLVACSPHVILVIDEAGTIRHCRGPMEELTGYRPVDVVGTGVLRYVDPTFHPLAIDALGTVMAGDGLQRPMLLRLRRRDGSWLVADVTANSQVKDPLIGGIVAYVRRADQRHCVEQVIAGLVGDAPLDEVLTWLCAALGTEHLDGDGCVLFAPDETRFTRAVGAPALPAPLLHDGGEDTPWRAARDDSAPSARPVDDLPEPHRGAATGAGYRWCWAWPVVLEGRVHGSMVLWRRADEVPGYAARSLLDGLADVAALVLRRELVADRLRYAATHDPLTGLANRSSLIECLSHALSDGAPGSSVGVLYVDLDEFKPVNDRFGHAVGDRVLTEVSRRLEESVRRGDLVVRMGGDEFAVACPYNADAAALGSMARRIIDAISTPMAIGRESVRVGASVGVAIAPIGAPLEDLVERADRALYTVKEAGRGGWRVAGLQPATGSAGEAGSAPPDAAPA
jgi:diguanylate cyclase (GGDEF)-like protein